MCKGHGILIETMVRTSNGSLKDEVGRKAGISGQSYLWRLYNLYDFDISRDLTCNVMHTLALCAFKKYVHMFVQYAERNGKIKDLDFVTPTGFLCFVNVSTNTL
jgi:hypothetical protein